jgi:hypothetical protein
MLRFLGFVVVLALLIGAFGYGRGWFTVDKQREGDETKVTFGLDRDKVEEDLRLANAKIDAKQRAIDEKMLRLRDRAARATADAKVEIDAELKELDLERTEISRKLDEMKAATGQKMRELRDEIAEELDRVEDSLDKALERFK